MWTYQVSHQLNRHLKKKTYVDFAPEAGRRSKAERPAGGGRGPEYGFVRPCGLFPKVEQ